MNWVASVSILVDAAGADRPGGANDGVGADVRAGAGAGEGNDGANCGGTQLAR